MASPENAAKSYLPMLFDVKGDAERLTPDQPGTMNMHYRPTEIRQ
jgi:hypothetical protein